MPAKTSIITGTSFRIVVTTTHSITIVISISWALQRFVPTMWRTLRRWQA